MPHVLLAVAFTTAAILFFAAKADAGDIIFVCAQNNPVRLPLCPAGCEERLYRFAPRYFGAMKRKRDMHKFLFQAGVFSPKAVLWFTNRLPVFA